MRREGNRSAHFAGGLSRSKVIILWLLNQHDCIELVYNVVSKLEGELESRIEPPSSDPIQRAMHDDLLHSPICRRFRPYSTDRSGR